MVETLGRLERVDLRDIWKTEGQHFTPWLAREEHIQLLGDAIGLDLELEAQEKDVGPFRADILCKDTLDNSWVLIENQIERTDHRHLGQLMTYAAGLDAVTIVWVASKFTEEHRSALDWLNKITDEKFRFFGLEVELLSINKSIPAPQFNVISKPNDWSSNVSRAARKIEYGEPKPLQELQLKYWSHLSEYLEQNSEMKIRSPRGQNWVDFSLGKTDAVLRISVNTQTEKLVTGVYLYKNMKEKYEGVYEQRNIIESALDEKLKWESDIDKKTAVIKLERDGNINNQDDWAEQHEWFKEKIESFRNIFRPIVRDFK